MRSDQELLEAWGSDDDDAGNELVERYVDVLYRFFRNKVRNDVSDLVQQALLSCVEGRSRLKHGTSFRSFLFGIARHTLYEHYRQRRRDAHIDFMRTTAEGLGTTPSRALGRMEDQQLLLDALQRIPLESQMMLELLFQQDMSSTEVAEVFGITGSAVRGRVSRALAQVRAMLIEREVEPSMESSNAAPSWTSRLFTEVTLAEPHEEDEPRSPGEPRS